MRRSRAVVSMPKSDLNPAASCLGELPDLAFETGGEPDRGRAGAGRPSRRRGPAPSASSRISSSSRLTTAMRGLPRQEAEAAEERLLVVGEVEPTEGRLGIEDGLAFLEDGELPDIAVALLGGDLLRQPVDPALDDGQVAQEELGFEGGQVAAGVDGFQGMRHRRIAERPDDGREGRRRSSACPGTAR